MRLPAKFSLADREIALRDLPPGWTPDSLAAGSGPWEIEVGFGKGRHLLRSAGRQPERRFLGIELVSKYYRLAAGRARRHGLDNLVVVRGEAHYLLSTALPRGFADKLHIYFPDPWPKTKHRKRRLLDPESVDLVLGTLRPGGVLEFATDFLEYGERVNRMLGQHPDLELTRHEEPWPDGARTNYEAKFMREGRPIIRLSARLADDATPGALHPLGRLGITAAVGGSGYVGPTLSE